MLYRYKKKGFRYAEVTKSEAQGLYDRPNAFANGMRSTRISVRANVSMQHSSIVTDGERLEHFDDP